jgi:hypothetical protein
MCYVPDSGEAEENAVRASLVGRVSYAANLRMAPLSPLYCKIILLVMIVHAIICIAMGSRRTFRTGVSHV